MTTPPEGQFNSICFVRTGGAADPATFERALRLSQRTQARLSVVSVVEPLPAGIVRLLASWGEPSELIDDETVEIEEVERLVETARSRGVDTSGEVLRGKTFLEVTRKILRDAHDLLIKAAQPPRAMQHMLFGHIDRQLIRKCPCPVWIEKPSGSKSIRRVLAAVDPAPFQDDLNFDPVREKLNTAIIEFGLLLAEIEHAELQIVHAWSFDLEMTLRTRAGVSEDVIAEIGSKVRQTHEQALEILLRPFIGHFTRVHFKKGHPGDEIVRLTTEESIDVVVMGTVCRSGLEGLLIGNTAETVIDHVNSCSIIALKPRGFVSPVRL